MKKLLSLVCLLFPFSLISQTNYGLPPFNMDDVRSLKDSGSLDDRRLKTGLWIEYQFDSTELKTFSQTMDQGYNSYPLYDKMLIKSVGKYEGGSRVGKWKQYKSYSISKPFKWDLEQEFSYNGNGLQGPWKYYKTDGKIIAQQNFKNGYPDGIYKKFFPNGKLQTLTPYKNGQVNGVQKYYNDKGFMISSAEVVNGNYSGKVCQYYSNGKLKNEMIYAGGGLLSETKLLDRNGKPLPKGTLENGQGTVISYNDVCAKTLSIEYKRGIPNGKIIEYYPNGAVKQELYCENGRVEGKVKAYDLKGKLTSETEVKEGMRTGKSVYYYSNGKVGLSQTWKEDLLWNVLISVDTAGKPLDYGTFKDGTGIIKLYDDSCRLVEVDEMKNGHRHGLAKTFYTNGKVAYEYQYSNDSVVGIAKTYYENGNIESESEFKKGNYNGIKKTYYPNGKVKLEIFLIENNCWNVIQQNDTNGKPVDRGTLKDGTGILKCYSDSGVLFQDMPFLNGRYNGVSTEYYPSGKIAGVSHYVNDTLEGTYTHYYENGQIMAIENMHKGYVDGKLLTYHENGKIWTEIEYIDGRVWSIKMNLDKDGHVLEKGTLKNGTGTLIYYDEEGRMNYILNIIHGETQPE